MHKFESYFVTDCMKTFVLLEVQAALWEWQDDLSSTQ